MTLYYMFLNERNKFCFSFLSKVSALNNVLYRLWWFLWPFSRSSLELPSSCTSYSRETVLLIKIISQTIFWFLIIIMP